MENFSIYFNLFNHSCPLSLSRPESYNLQMGECDDDDDTIACLLFLRKIYLIHCWDGICHLWKSYNVFMSQKRWRDRIKTDLVVRYPYIYYIMTITSKSILLRVKHETITKSVQCNSLMKCPKHHEVRNIKRD